MQCLCGEETDGDACPACGLDAATIRAVQDAETPVGTLAGHSSGEGDAGEATPSNPGCYLSGQAPPRPDGPSPTVAYQPRPWCENCFSSLERGRYCDECRSLLELAQAAYQDLADRHQRRLDAAWQVPLPEPAYEADGPPADRRGPRAQAAWVARKHPEVAWLACLESDALAFHLAENDPLRARLQHSVLRETFPNVRPIEWAALLPSER